MKDKTAEHLSTCIIIFAFSTLITILSICIYLSVKEKKNGLNNHSEITRETLER